MHERFVAIRVRAFVTFAFVYSGDVLAQREFLQEFLAALVTVEEVAFPVGLLVTVQIRTGGQALVAYAAHVRVFGGGGGGGTTTATLRRVRRRATFASCSEKHENPRELLCVNLVRVREDATLLRAHPMPCARRTWREDDTVARAQRRAACNVQCHGRAADDFQSHARVPRSVQNLVPKCALRSKCASGEPWFTQGT